MAPIGFFAKPDQQKRPTTRGGYLKKIFSRGGTAGLRKNVLRCILLFNKFEILNIRSVHI
jgi:hypothetical protein